MDHTKKNFKRAQKLIDDLHFKYDVLDDPILLHVRRADAGRCIASLCMWRIEIFPNLLKQDWNDDIEYSMLHEFVHMWLYSKGLRRCNHNKVFQEHLMIVLSDHEKIFKTSNVREYSRVRTKLIKEGLMVDV